MRPEVEDVVETYRTTGSINETARATHLSAHTVRHLLITAGIHKPPRVNQIWELTAQGYSYEDIAKTLGLSRATVLGYLPYAHGPTSCGERSENALRIEQCRRKKREQTKEQGKQYREKAPRKALFPQRMKSLVILAAHAASSFFYHIYHALIAGTGLLFY